jgi:hypothetical protein
MLKITVPGVMLHDPRTDRIWRIKETQLTLEHSLVSLSKWESKWHKPFLNQKITADEFNDYVRCMTLTQNVDPNVYAGITADVRKQIEDYMDDPMTAAVIKDDPSSRGGSQFITSDLIYYWMVALRIPFECQKWHLNRLLTLIRITSIEQKPKKKMSTAENMRRHHDTNAARRAARKH